MLSLFEFLCLFFDLFLKLLEKFRLESLFSLFSFNTLFVGTFCLWKWWNLRLKALISRWSLRRFLRDCKYVHWWSVIVRFWCRSLRSILIWKVFRQINNFSFFEIMRLFFILTLWTCEFITRIERKSIIFLTFLIVRWMMWKLTYRIDLFNFLLLFSIWSKIVNIFTWTIIYWWSKVRIRYHDSWPVIILKHIRKLSLIVIFIIFLVNSPRIRIFTINHLWALKWTFHSRYFFSWILYIDHFIFRIYVFF